MIRKERIESILSKELAPEFLSVENESRYHHVPPESETHFKAIAVSPQFKTLKRIERHKLVHKLLENEFSQGLHALTLHLYTPDEWVVARESILKSPACKDGFDK